jgi:dipeptidyl aminopeptidase/acylaminoacyl peptidase
MRHIIYIILFLLAISSSYGQKKPIDFNCSYPWPDISETLLSNNGKILAYHTIWSNRDSTIGDTLTITSIDNTRNTKLSNACQPVFTSDDQAVWFRKNKDSIGVLDIRKSNITYITSITDYLPPIRNSKWLIFSHDTAALKKVHVYDLERKNESIYNNVDAYVRSQEGNALILIRKIEGKESVCLFLLNQERIKETCIGKYKNPRSFVFDKTGMTVAFIADSDSGITKIYLHKPELSSTVILLASNDSLLSNNMISGLNFFNQQANKLFFNISRPVKNIKSNNLNTARINIQSIYDDSFQSLQSKNSLLAVLQTKSPYRFTVLQLDKDNGKLIANTSGNARELLVKSNGVGRLDDYKWKKSAISDLYLVNTTSGKRILLKEKLFGDAFFSSGGKYVVWFDRLQQQWFSYNIITAKTVNISNKISTKLVYDSDYPNLMDPVGFAGWLKNDKGILIYDIYDIWLVDPDGIDIPINITDGYGLKNNLRLRYLNTSGVKTNPMDPKRDFLLTAFNERTKGSGFFKTSILSGKVQKLLMLDKLCFGVNGELDGSIIPNMPIKANNADQFVINITDVNEYPNLYTTKDFKKLSKLSNFNPHNNYSWITSELICWQLPDSSIGEGILYKPDNFDSSIKYPIIFYYYERNSEKLHAYLKPQLSKADLNIPMYISSGYLVFVPDIKYEIGYPGYSAFKIVNSAAEYLSQKPWINSRKMGLQGHSFGGFETSCIVAHSALFKAAITASGFCESVSFYGKINWQSFFENGQGRIGASLWDRPDLYIANSPVLKADKIVTPMLIIHGKEDITVSLAQSLELYLALRRLQKKAWFVTYKKADHIFSKPEEKLDYSIRMKQFFDYYLMDRPAPRWMTGNYNPDQDGIEGGYILDNTAIP